MRDNPRMEFDNLFERGKAKFLVIIDNVYRGGAVSLSEEFNPFSYLSAMCCLKAPLVVA